MVEEASRANEALIVLVQSTRKDFALGAVVDVCTPPARCYFLYPVTLDRV